MKKPILFIFAMLYLWDLSAQTIDVNSTCFGGTFTFTYDAMNSPDGSGRNVYYYAMSSLEIRYNTGASQWEIRARGGNFDVYFTNTFASSPNPPDNTTSTWVPDGSICTDNPTVTGSGTQSTIGTDPCAMLGGDTDMDGVCDDNDVCPGFDDNADMDMDHIPDGCDPNPTVADGVLFNAPCLDAMNPIIFLFAGMDSGGRNIYNNLTYQVEIAYNPMLGRWELRAQSPGTDVYFYNTYASFPNPPDDGTSSWVGTSVLMCDSNSPTASGTGTQDSLGCMIAITSSSKVNPPCGNDGSITVTASGGQGTVTYLLSGPVMATNATGMFTNLPAGFYTFTASDDAFPDAVCVASDTVTLFSADTTRPVAVCQNITVYLDGSGNASITGGDVDGGSSDNCNIASTMVSPSAFTCANVGGNPVTLTVTDASMNSNSCMATVTVRDTTRPIAVCQNITVYLSGSGSATVFPGDVDGGSSDNCGTGQLTSTPAVFGCANIGSNNVRLIVNDVNSNSSSCTAVVTILDSVRPVAVCQNITVYLDGSGNASITGSDVDGGSSDNCGISTRIANPASFTCINRGSNPVSLTLQDASGNMNQCMAYVTVTDSVRPTVTCPGTQTRYMDINCNYSVENFTGLATATDNCGMPVLSQSPSPGTTLNGTGNTVVAMMAVDGSGNSASCLITLILEDTIPPSISCPMNFSNAVVGPTCMNALADYTGLAMVNDNCDPSAVVTQQPAPGTLTGVGMVQVTLYATDASGNIDSCGFSINVVDNTPPTALCKNITVYLDNSGSASISPMDLDNGSTDNCSIQSYQSGFPSVSCANIGLIIDSLYVTDPSGNVGRCASYITVRDTTAPVVTCQNIMVDIQNTMPDPSVTIMPGDVQLMAPTDACGIASTYLSQSTFTCNDLWDNSIYLVAVDNNGNRDSCMAIVTVDDPNSFCCDTPMITCPPDITVTTAPFACVSQVPYADPTIVSNCIPIVTRIAGPASDSLLDIGTYLVTYTASNAPTKNDTCSFTITVLENGQAQPLQSTAKRAAAGLACQDHVNIS
ncbi:MAG: HYR domain-containing protein, partial [Saprospiraceae bacterium]|nr:HYR domain-containing protein [Saprospiraceae bacterium]